MARKKKKKWCCKTIFVVIGILVILALAGLFVYYQGQKSAWANCSDEPVILNISDCPDIFKPVCGDNNITYDNTCIACLTGNIEQYKLGVCENGMV